MESALFELAASQGIWVVMFVLLFLYTIKNNKEIEKRQEQRENKYLDIISSLMNKFEILNQIKEDIENVKESIENIILKK